MDSDKTIVAISTPMGVGGIGIIRLSGSRAIAIADQIVRSERGGLQNRAANTIIYSKIVDPDTGELVDEALVSVMRAPNSYTREDVVEINSHSGRPILNGILKLLLKQGACLAQPGEFTKRAFLSGRIDLTQAQAVAGLVRAKSDAMARAAARQADGHLARIIKSKRAELVGLAAELEAAVDFSEEDIELPALPVISRKLHAARREVEGLLKSFAGGRVLDQGLATAIIGRPNVGKSSLLNALLMEDKAIVSALPGTTRDIVEGQVVLGDIPLQLKDTAGWRSPGDDIEAEGIKRSRRALEQAELALLVLDRSEPLQKEDHLLMDLLADDKPLVVVLNKSDLPDRLSAADLPPKAATGYVVNLSAVTGDGLSELGTVVERALGMSALEGNEVFLATAQQEQDLSRAREKLCSAIDALNQGFSEEILSTLIKDAIGHLGQVSGESIAEEIIDQIFSRFCIGK